MTTQTNNEAAVKKFQGKSEYEGSESTETDHYSYEKATEHIKDNEKTFFKAKKL